MLIKICGIKTPEIALAAAQAGADFIGVVFAKQSKRLVNIEQVKQIVSAIKHTSAKVVAVFAEQTADEIKTMCQQTGITVAQLHGDPSRAALTELTKLNIIFAVRVNDDGEIMDPIPPSLRPQQDYLLFDAQHAGSGKSFNWKNFHYEGPLKWFLSGGLNPDNVAQAIDILHPYGLDVSSGVEMDGEKNVELIQRFCDLIPSPACGRGLG